MPHFFFRGILFSVLEVGGDGAVKEQGFLGHNTQMAPQFFLTEIPDINAVDEHLTAGGIVDPGDQVDQRGFAGACGANDGGGLTGPGCKAHMFQYGAVRLGIAEGYIPEFQPLKRSKMSFLRRIQILYGGIVFQNLVDTADGGHGSGDHIHHHGGRHYAH